MEIRKRKKNNFGGKHTGAIIAVGGCVFVTYLVVSLCQHVLLNAGGPAKATRSGAAEDAQYQLNRGRIENLEHWHRGAAADDDGTDDESSSGSGDDEEDQYFRDPGSMDEPLSFLEKSRVDRLRLPRTIDSVDESIPYDVHRCPPEIPENYPYAWSTIDVLKHWNPDDTDIPDTIHQGLCSLDWTDPAQRKIAVHYRKSEVPFVVKNHPVIWRTADRWSDYGYMHEKLGDKGYRNEYSENNHMMYWKLHGKRRGPPGWEPPTENVKLSYPEWYEKATALEEDPDSSATSEHYYLRLNGGTQGPNPWLFDELSFFDPAIQNDVFMVDPTDARGINCRLGSRGTIAETHYDMSRNFIMILKGRKRYVLGHPDQCVNMELYPVGHPSARHSLVNWSDPESWFRDGRNFRNGMVNEVVLDAGDGLYLPTYWLHFIVSLSLNYQCNARSGISYEYQEHINECGFGK